MTHKQSTIFFLTAGVILLSGVGCTLADRAQTGINALNNAKTLVENINAAVKNQADHHTVIVAGYGTPVKGNTQYEQYIKNVATYVTNETNGVNSVVFSGSYTNNPDLSEAESMNSYFNSQVDTTALQNRGVKIYKEECSIMSWQNISYTQELLASKDIHPTVVTLFGDQNRSDKLKTFAAYKFNLAEGIPNDTTALLNSALNVATVQFEGFNFGDAVESQDKRNAKFAAEIVGAYDAKTGNEILGKRLGEWTNTFGFDISDNLVKKGCTQYSGF